MKSFNAICQLLNEVSGMVNMKILRIT
ncbi:hypothetical protein IL54_2715 [Sphingobium sp. ba1]|nr:hypothetical protein IL54_2715 [Sphingobium sp. ba1]